MTRAEVEAAGSLVGRVLALLLVAAGADQAGLPGAELRRLAGDLEAAAVRRIRAATLFGPLAECFGLARASGASFAALERVRGAIAAEGGAGAAAALIRVRCIGFCLVQQAQVLADTTFTSRQDVDAAAAVIHPAFSAAEEAAADAGDQEIYRALVTLHAGVTRDLTTRARPLPRLVAYVFPQSMPALALANRLYGDASRTGDLIAENKASHPLFMPASGRALSD